MSALNSILSAAYTAKVLNRGTTAEVQQAFRRQAELEPGIVSEAQQRRKAIVTQVTDKCVVSKVHADFLDSVL